jgi:hypothetical protein
MLKQQELASVSAFSFSVAAEHVWMHAFLVPRVLKSRLLFCSTVNQMCDIRLRYCLSISVLVDVFKFELIDLYNIFIILVHFKQPHTPLATFTD